MNEAIAEIRTEDEPIKAAGPARRSDADIEKSYLDAINALLEEAYSTRSVPILVDVLTWTVARIIMDCRSRWGTGDVLRRIGDYVCRISERRAAQEEAEKSRADGSLPH
jgi:hypothetical protein